MVRGTHEGLGGSRPTSPRWKEEEEESETEELGPLTAGVQELEEDDIIE